MYSLNVSTERIITWMNTIREEAETKKYRLLENFWASQLHSKAWLVNTIKQKLSIVDGNVYIFGGWYGILAQLIVDNLDTNKVYSIDIDEECQMVGSKLSNKDRKIIFLTKDMKNFLEYDNPALIINTSTEHVNQTTFEYWMDAVPNNVPIVLQGNNFYDCKEHIRCTKTLEDFKESNLLKKYVYAGELICQGPTGPFTRFMSIGYKNDY